MPHYVIVYLGGDQPSCPDDGQRHYAKYKKWFASMDASAVSPANPFKNTITINPDKTVTQISSTVMSGYTIIEADSMNKVQ